MTRSADNDVVPTGLAGGAVEVWLRELVRSEARDAIAAVLDAQTPRSQWLDSDGIARHLGCSRATVDRLAREHGLPYSRLGDQRRYSVAAVDAWLQARTGELAHG